MSRIAHEGAPDAGGPQKKVYINEKDPNYKPLTAEEAIHKLRKGKDEIKMDRKQFISNAFYGLLGIAAGYLTGQNPTSTELTPEELDALKYRASYLADEYQKAQDAAKLATEKLSRQTAKLLERIFTKPYIIHNESTSTMGRTLLVPIQEGQRGFITTNTGTEITLKYGMNVVICRPEDSHTINGIGLSIYDLSLLDILDEEDLESTVRLILTTGYENQTEQEWHQIKFDEETQTLLNNQIFPFNADQQLTDKTLVENISKNINLSLEPINPQ